ncbi:MAG: hypothetical protein ACOC28_04695 [Alkalispirochaetaceae bacterium]
MARLIDEPEGRMEILRQYGNIDMVGLSLHPSRPMPVSRRKIFGG